MTRCFMGLGLGFSSYPLFRHLSSTLGRPDANTHKALAVEVDPDSTPGASKMVMFNNRPVLIVRSPESEWIALAGTCTHIGCLLRYDPEANQLICPCHQGRFDLAGKVVGGPPPSALRSYRVEAIESGVAIHG